MPLWLRGIFASALFAAGAAALSCSKDEPTGQLTIAIQTDLAMPKDLNYVRLEVRNDGLPLGTENPYPLHRNDYAINPADPPDLRVTIPATFAVYNTKGAAQPIAVRVTAGRDGQPRVLRDAITAVPSDRNAMLRMSLQWLSDGSAVPVPGATDPRQANSSCPPLQTSIAGECLDSRIELDRLPDFSPSAIYGGESAATGHAFDVLSCFAAPETVTTDAACSFALPAGVAPENLNVGLELPPGSDGVCNADHCVVPLDRQEALTAPLDSWFVLAGRIQLPRGVCTRAATFPSMKVVFSRACPAKTPSTPLCSPSSPVTDCSIHGPEDGGAHEPAMATSSPILSLGRAHTCVRSGASVRCWGRNANSQSGAGALTGIQQSMAVVTPFQAEVIHLSAGVDTTCVVSNGARCWGNNRYGQRGDTPIFDTNTPTPTTVAGDTAPPRIVAVSSSGTESHACASGTNGSGVARTWCWGANTMKQLGTGVPNGLSPGFDLDARVLALGADFTLALLPSGRVESWGNNVQGQLGQMSGAGGAPKIRMPGNEVILPAGAMARDVVAGQDFACALLTDGTVQCWGNARKGAVTGDVMTQAPLSPVPKALGGKALAIAAGLDFACAVIATIPEVVECWGDNSVGQLGSPTPTSHYQKLAMPAGIQPPFDAIVAGGQRACVISGKTVACWGDNSDGQIYGAPSAPFRPQVVPFGL